MNREVLERLNKKITTKYTKLDFNVGDTITVSLTNKTKDKQYTQRFTGEVISITGSGMLKNFLVRRVVKSYAVELTIPNSLPEIEKIEIVTRRKMRRAKLYYLRKLRFKVLRTSLQKKQLKNIHRSKKTVSK